MNDRERGGRGDDRDGWGRDEGRVRHPGQGASLSYDPYADRGMSTRDYAYGQHHDARDPEQTHQHGRAVGEHGYGSEYRGRDGYGAVGSASIGRGPKNYVRSDERMREEICERLSAQPYDWSDVEVHVSDGEATLTGTVRTREMKYVGERIAESVHGVRDVMNQIRIAQPAAASDHVSGSDGSDAKRARSAVVSR